MSVSQRFINRREGTSIPPASPLLGAPTPEFEDCTFGKIPDHSLLDALHSHKFQQANAAIAAGV
jgi:hypothetical protein